MGPGSPTSKRRGEELSPGSEVIYRVDGNPALSWTAAGETAGRSAEVISGMLSGQEIEARYIALEVSPGKLFPNRLPRTARASLAGFAEAHAEMRRRLDAYGGR
jgi:hypothetical protein